MRISVDAHAIGCRQTGNEVYIRNLLKEFARLDEDSDLIAFISKEEVKAILGSPSSSSTEDKLIYKRTTWRYVEGDKYINITFKNDELDRKDTKSGYAVTCKMPGSRNGN